MLKALLTLGTVVGAATRAPSAPRQASLPQRVSPPVSVDALIAGVDACVRAFAGPRVDEHYLKSNGWAGVGDSSETEPLHLFMRDNVLVEVMFANSGPLASCHAAAHLNSTREYAEVIAHLRRLYGQEHETDANGDVLWVLSSEKSVRFSPDREEARPGADISVGFPPKGPVINVTVKDQ